MRTIADLAWLRSPLVLDVIIGAVLVEGIGLALFRARTGRGMPISESIAFLGAGLGLLAAMRLRASALAFAAAMLVGLVCHLWFIWLRK